MDCGAWWAAAHGVAKSQTRLSDFTFTFHFHALEKEMAIHSSILAWRIPGMAEPGGLPSMGSHRVGHNWSDLAAAAAAAAADLIFFFLVDEIFLLFVCFKYTFIYFNWRLITLQYCIGFALITSLKPYLQIYFEVLGVRALIWILEGQNTAHNNICKWFL